MSPFAFVAAALAVTGAAGQSSAGPSGAPRDVPPNHWAFPAVDNLFKANVLKGYPDGTFKGSRPASRYELAVMIAAMTQDYTGSLSAIQRQLEETNRKLDERRANEQAAKDLMAQIETLRAQLDQMKRQQSEVASLNGRFQALNDQLLKIRANLSSARETQEKVKAKTGA